MGEVILSLGSNLGDRLVHLRETVSKISDCGYFNELCFSSVYESQPQDMESGNLFLNMVLKAKTCLSPEAVLNYIKTLECGRKRETEKRYSDRHIDIDILFYDNLVLNTNELTIPHPRLNLRRFILVPLLEIDPYFKHPILGKTAGQMLDEIKDSLFWVTKFGNLKDVY